MDFASPYTSLAVSWATISLVPLALLVFIPKIGTYGLSLGKAFAAGGLLGDVFFHAGPEAAVAAGGSMASQLSLFQAMMAGFGFFLLADVLIRILGFGASSNDQVLYLDADSESDENMSDDDTVEADSDDDVVDYNSLPVASLKELCANRSIAVPSRAKKADIVDLLNDGTDGPYSDDEEELSDSDNEDPTSDSDLEDVGDSEVVFLITNGRVDLDLDLDDETSPANYTRLTLLSILSDALHNFTDGLALGAAAVLTPTVGVAATALSPTTLAIFMHEVPHELGDYAVLVSGGFSKWGAVGMQIVTSMSCLLGGIVGIAISQGSLDWGLGGSHGGPTLSGIICGGFVYVACCGLIPEVFGEGGGDVGRGEMVMRTLAFVAGVGLMVLVVMQGDHDGHDHDHGHGHGHGHDHGHHESAATTNQYMAGHDEY